MPQKVYTRAYIDTCAYMHTHKWNTFKKRNWDGSKSFIFYSQKNKNRSSNSEETNSNRKSEKTKRQENDAVYSEKLLLKYSKN